MPPLTDLATPRLGAFPRPSFPPSFLALGPLPDSLHVGYAVQVFDALMMEGAVVYGLSDRELGQLYLNAEGVFGLLDELLAQIGDLEQFCSSEFRAENCLLCNRVRSAYAHWQFVHSRQHEQPGPLICQPRPEGVVIFGACLDGHTNQSLYLDAEGVFRALDELLRMVIDLAAYCAPLFCQERQTLFTRVNATYWEWFSCYARQTGIVPQVASTGHQEEVVVNTSGRVEVVEADAQTEKQADPLDQHVEFVFLFCQDRQAQAVAERIEAWGQDGVQIILYGGTARHGDDFVFVRLTGVEHGSPRLLALLRDQVIDYVVCPGTLLN